MHIQVLKENLLSAFQIASRFSAQKMQMPILSNLAIYAESEGIFVVGSDVDRSIELRVGGKVLEKGSFCVPARLLSELAQSLPLGAVDIKVEDGKSLEIGVGRVKATLQGLTTEDYPRPEREEAGLVDLGSFTIKDWQWVLERLFYAVSKDETRPILTGILWEMEQSVMVATDGYRLSIVEDKLGSGIAGAKTEPMVVPGALINEVVKVMDDLGVEEMRIRYQEETKELLMQSDDVKVAGRVLEGDYPKYEAILPEDFRLQVKVSRDELLRAVKVAAIFARESANIVTFVFNEGGLQVSANAPQVGENVAGVEVELEKGTSEGEIAFNCKYLTDYLSAKGKKEVIFGMNDALQPGVFMEGKASKYRHVIMPVRVKKGE